MQRIHTTMSGLPEGKSRSVSAAETQPKSLLWEYLSVFGALMGISAVTITTLVLLVTTLVQASEQDRQVTLSIQPVIPSMNTIDPWAYNNPYNDHWDPWEDQYPENVQLAALSDNDWHISR